MIDRFLDMADAILIGGAMSFTFLKAQGFDVGASKVEEEGVAVAAEALMKAESRACELILPTDVVVAEQFAETSPSQVVDVGAIPPRVDGSGYRARRPRQRIRRKIIGCRRGVLERSDGCVRDGRRSPAARRPWRRLWPRAPG